MAACALSRLDATRIAAMGGSFGGYMANWIAVSSFNDSPRIVTHARCGRFRAIQSDKPITPTLASGA